MIFSIFCIFTQYPHVCDTFYQDFCHVFFLSFSVGESLFGNEGILGYRQG